MWLFGVLSLLSTALVLGSRQGVGDQQPLWSTQHWKDYRPLSDDSFDKFVNDTIHELLTPGLAVAIVHGNQTFAKGYGYADLETQEPMTPRTLCFPGSTTKSITAATMSKLVYSNDSKYGNIKWDSKLVDLIRDDFVLQDEWVTNHVTLTDALSHRTGMPRHDFSWLNHNPSPRSIVRSMRNLALHNEIRTTWEYCNLMFVTVGYAIETVTGASLGTLMKDWIWEPLCMNETFWSVHDALAYAEQTDGVTMSKGYLYDNDTKMFVVQPYSIIPPPNGAGSIVSNVLDYTHWIRTFLHPENSSNPLTAEAIDYMTQPHMIIPKGQSFSPLAIQAYGLGLDTGIYRGHKLINHSGAINGWYTFMGWLPELDWGVVIMQNTYSWALEAVFWELMDDFLDTPEDERVDFVSESRKAEARAVHKFANAREILYPDAGKDAATGPALPLQAYEGTYSHPAYKGVKLSMSSAPGEAESGAPLPLYAVPAQKSYLNTSGVLHHVSGEFWYAHYMTSPSSWLADDIMKARFEIGVDGTVKALLLQVEPAMDKLARFEKIA